MTAENNSSYEILFKPGKIGTCTIPNRLVVPAMVANMCSDEGKASDQYIACHMAKAKGGWGLIITEDYAINEHAAGYPHIAGLYRGDQIESHKRFTDAVHRYPTKVFVAGGGVAGMEAARIAALKGHHVIVFEASDALGGQFVLAGYPPYKGAFTSFPAWQVRQLSKLGVEVRLNTPLTADEVIAAHPDKVIVATGATPTKRHVKGLENNHVVTAIDVLAGKADAGDDVIVLGGGMIGSETASFLSTQCKASVALSTRQTDIGLEMDRGIKDDLKGLLQKNFVQVYTRAKPIEVTEEDVWLNVNGNRIFHPYNTVVTAFGMTSEKDLAKKLIGIVDFTAVGNAVEPRTGIEAIREGFLAGYSA